MKTAGTVVAVLASVSLFAGCAASPSSSGNEETSGTTGNSTAATSASSGEEAVSSTSAGTTASSGTAAAGSYTIAWCNNSSSDDYQVALTAQFEKNAKELGVDLVEFDAQGDTQTQANNVEQAISQGVDAILITCNDATGLASSLTQARDAGIKVVTCAADVAEDYRDTARDTYVGADDTAAGEMAAQAMKDQFPDGAKIVQIEGQAGYDAQIKRTDGFEKGLEGSNIEILDSQAVSQWDANQAMKIMEDFIVKYGDEIDGVFVHWDVGAGGVVEALDASNLNTEDLFIVSIDGCKVGVDNVKSGKTDVCIMQDLDGTARIAMESAIKLINGEKVESEINPDLIEVTKDNCNDYNPTW